MNYYIIKNKNMPWGDYGNVLFRGFLNVMDKNYHELEIPEIERTGPFVPKIYITNTRDLVVSDDVRNLIRQEKISGVESYKTIRIKKIVNVDWDQWDFTKPDPAIYPKSGEPEDYIFKGNHDETLVSKIPHLWNPVIIEEKVLKVKSNTRDKINFSHLIIDKPIKYDIVCSLPNIVVSEKFKEVIEQNHIDSIRFIKVKSEI